jgi:hypothetical protein
MLGQIIISISSFLIITAALMSLIYDGPALIVAQFLIIPCILAARFEMVKTVFVICLAGTILVFSFIFFGIDNFACILTIAIIDLMPFLVTRLNLQYESKQSGIEKRLKDVKMDLAKIQDQVQAVDIYNREMDQRYNEISGLYEMAKEMSASLSFAEIFKILKGFMKGKFVFRQARLVLVEEKEEGYFVKKVYGIIGEETRDSSAETEIEELDGMLLDYFRKNRREPLYFTRPENDKEMHRFGLP